MKHHFQSLITISTETIAAILLLLMMGQIVFDVLVRWLFGGGLPGTMTFVSSYYMVGVSFIPLALVNLRREHITVDILQGLIKGKLKKVLNVIVAIITSVTVAIMCLASFSEALDRLAAGTSIIQGAERIIVWPSYFLYSFGLLFFLLSIPLAMNSNNKL